MSEKRWFVVRPIKLNKEEVNWGQYLTPKQAAEIPADMFKVLVRGVRLFDTTGEIDIPWRERNKLKLRHRAFTEIGTPEALKLMNMSIEAMANGRVQEFGSPREKALAEEVKQEKAAVVEEAPPAPKPKRKKRKKVEVPKEDLEKQEEDEDPFKDL